VGYLWLSDNLGVSFLCFITLIAFSCYIFSDLTPLPSPWVHLCLELNYLVGRGVEVAGVFGQTDLGIWVELRSVLSSYIIPLNNSQLNMSKTQQISS
jgi:hypothetical protein